MSGDAYMAALLETLEELPGFWVRGGPRAPSATEDGAWRVYLEVNPIQGGCDSLAVVLCALKATKIRCGVAYDEHGVGPWDEVIHVLACRGGTTPEDAASLIAETAAERGS